MTREEVIQGLQFTIEMFLFDPSTGETLTEPRNNLDKATIDACKGAIELLKQQPCEDCISREQTLKCHYYIYDEYGNWLDVVDASDIERLPSVQPQPKRGKWIFNENMHDYCCSECGCLMPNVNEYYRKKIIGCPYCLADMREVQDDGI